MRTKLALLAAIVLGILAAIGVKSFVTRKEMEYEAKGKRVAITVAREDLNFGDELRLISVKPVEVEEIAVTGDHVLYDNVKQYQGQKLQRRVATGQALLKPYFLAAPGREDFAAKKVDLFKRAVTIGTDQIAGVAGLITPGSKVDVIGTFRIIGRSPGESTAAVETRVVVSNVEVLAVDSRTDVRIPVRGGRLADMDRGYSSITLHVTPMEASVLVFAQSAGKINFVLRNAEDQGLSVGNIDPEKAQKDDVPPITLTDFNNLVGEAARRRALATKARPGLLEKLPPPPAPRE